MEEDGITKEAYDRIIKEIERSEVVHLKENYGSHIKDVSGRITDVRYSVPISPYNIKIKVLFWGAEEIETFEGADIEKFLAFR